MVSVMSVAGMLDHALLMCFLYHLQVMYAGWIAERLHSDDELVDQSSAMERNTTLLRSPSQLGLVLLVLLSMLLQCRSINMNNRSK